MIGQRQIVVARQDGQKPSAIFVELGYPPKAPKAVGDKALHAALYDPECALGAELLPTVYVSPRERPDMRFAIGCNVAVSGPEWSEKLISLGHAVADAGAAVVIVSAPSDSDDLMIFSQGKWTS